MCPRTTWLLESLPNIGGWTLPGGSPGNKDNNLKIFFLFRAEGGASGWDSAVSEASEIYGKH